MGQLDGKRALVTGASRGLGRAIAMGFAREGAAVALNWFQDRDNVEETLRLIEAEGGTAFAVEADVSSEAAVEAMFDEALPRLGGLDILVNNAGVSCHTPLLETAAADFDRVVGINLRGPFLVGKRGIREMVGRDDLPRVINIASELAYLGRGENSVYCATKGGVLTMTRSWAREFAPEILVNAIGPGPIDTDMLAVETIGEDEREMERQIPLQRLGRPEEVAAVAVFLAGPGATFMTGQCIGPNGGAVMA